MNGWFKLHRRLLMEPLWLAGPFTRGQAWADLIGLTNHTDGFILVRGNRVEVKRGQCGWSEVKLAARWGWSRNRLRRFLFELKKDGRIEQQKNTITSLISIVNYEIYQGGDTADGTADGTADDTADDTLTRRKKKVKKNGEGTFVPPTPTEVDEYAASIGYHKPNLGRDFCHKYDATGWRIKGGKKMENWKLTVQTWRREDEQHPRRPAGQPTPVEPEPAPVVRGTDGRTPRERYFAQAEAK